MVVVLLACGGEQRDGSVTTVGDDPDYESTPSLAISPTGQLAIAWEHRSMSSVEARVAVLEGSQWTQLGSDVTTAEEYGGNALGPYIAFQPDGTLLLMTSEEGGTNYWDGIIMVRRWTGTAWEVLGDSGGPVGQAAVNARMVIDSTGAPVIAADIAHWGETSEITVRRWDGATWAEVWGAPISAAPDWFFDDLLLDASGQLVLLTIHYEGETLGVSRWDGAAWQDLPAFPRGEMGHRLAIDSSGALLAATMMPDITLRRFDGAAWTASPPTSVFSNGQSIFNEDTPVVAEPSGGALVGWQEGEYTSFFSNSPARNYVRRWTGETWQPVLGPFDSGCGGTPFRMQMLLGGPFDTEPVVAWVEVGEGAWGKPCDKLYVRVPR
jgi:hypothetical protein